MENQRFIDCALQQKYITLKNLKECRDIQKNLPTLGIDQILQTHGFLDESKCSIVNAILKYKDESLLKKFDTNRMRKKDRIIAGVLVNEKILTVEMIGQIINLQKQLKQSGQKFPLINVIIAKKNLWQDASWENWENLNGNGSNEIIYFTKVGEEGKAFLINKENISMKLIGKNEWTIGRFATSNRIVIEETTVSRIHCKLIFKNDQWQITDMMSVSGVYLNGNRILKEIISNNDILRIGSKQFEIKM